MTWKAATLPRVYGLRIAELARGYGADIGHVWPQGLMLILLLLWLLSLFGALVVYSRPSGN